MIFRASFQSKDLLASDIFEYCYISFIQSVNETQIDILREAWIGIFNALRELGRG